jgi:hypothetical protein
MVDVSHGVEGVVCEEQEGRVNVYSVFYCVLQGFGVLEISRALFRTPASAYIPAITFPSSFGHLEKSGKANKK